MALTRKFLKALGVSEEAIEEIITAHTDVTDELKAQLKTAQEAGKQLEEVTKERDTLKAKADDTKSAEKIAELEKQVAAYQKAETDGKKKTVLTELLESAGIDKRGFSKVIAATDFDSIELDKDGKIKDSEKLSEKLKSEWADLLVTENTDTAKPATPPAEVNKTFTPEDIRKMSPKEINENFNAIKESLKGEK